MVALVLVFNGEYIMNFARYTLTSTKIGVHLVIALDGVWKVNGSHTNNSPSPYQLLRDIFQGCLLDGREVVLTIGVEILSY